MRTSKLQKIIETALREDIGSRDLTTELTVPESSRYRATLTAKQDGRLGGMDIFRSVDQGEDIFFSECKLPLRGDMLKVEVFWQTKVRGSL